MWLVPVFLLPVPLSFSGRGWRCQPSPKPLLMRMSVCESSASESNPGCVHAIHFWDIRTLPSLGVQFNMTLGPETDTGCTMGQRRALHL